MSYIPLLLFDTMRPAAQPSERCRVKKKIVVQIPVDVYSLYVWQLSWVITATCRTNVVQNVLDIYHYTSNNIAEWTLPPAGTNVVQNSIDIRISYVRQHSRVDAAACGTNFVQTFTNIQTIISLIDDTAGTFACAPEQCPRPQADAPGPKITADSSLVTA